MATMMCMHAMSRRSYMRAVLNRCLAAESGIDCVNNRHAAVGERTVRKRLRGIAIPSVALERYSFWLPGHGERFIAWVERTVADGGRPGTVAFLRKFIESRLEVIVRAELPVEGLLAIDFGELAPMYDGEDPATAWAMYLATLGPVEGAARMGMPEILCPRDVALDALEVLDLAPVVDRLRRLVGGC